MIHATALVDEGATLGEDVEVGAFSMIGAGVTLGPGTWIGPHVVIEGPTTIGARCRIFQYASVGTPPQDLKYDGEPTKLIIGDDNTIREFVTLNRGTVGGGGETRIGNGNLLMAYCHVAHDCVVGNGVIMANGASLAGHVEIEDQAILGGFVGVHQFVRVGAHTMIGALTGVGQDIPPYMMAAGHRVRLHGLNVIGLRRSGISSDTIKKLRQAYQKLFRTKLPLDQAIAEVREEVGGVEEVDRLLAFMAETKRGICRKAEPPGGGEAGQV